MDSIKGRECYSINHLITNELLDKNTVSEEEDPSDSRQKISSRMNKVCCIFRVA